MFSVTSTSSSPPPSLPPSPSDWSKNKVQSEMGFSSGSKLNTPFGMTYSPDLKLFYVCDSGNNRIHVFRNHPQAQRAERVEIEFLPPLWSSNPSSSNPSPTCSSSALALNPPYTVPHSLSFPSGICYHDGQLFIVDSEKHQVHVWREEDGSFLWMIGTGSAGKAVGQFINPCGCTVYQNHLFVSDSGNHRIQKFSFSDWSVAKVIGSFGSRLGQLFGPTGLSVYNDKLYVADYLNDRISVFDPESGAALSVIGPSLSDNKTLHYPRGLCFSHNLIFVSSQHRIFVFDSDHNYLYSFGSVDSESDKSSSFQGMVMVNDKLYVSDSGRKRIQVFEQRLI